MAKEEWYLKCNGGNVTFLDGALVSIKKAEGQYGSWHSCLVNDKDLIFDNFAHVKVNLIEFSEDKALIELDLKEMRGDKYSRQKFYVPKEDIVKKSTPDTLYEKLNVLGKLRKAVIHSPASLSLDVLDAQRSHDLLADDFRSKNLEVAVNSYNGVDVGISISRIGNERGVSIEGYTKKGKSAVNKLINYLSKQQSRTEKAFVFN